MKHLIILISFLLITSCAHTKKDPSRSNVEVTKTLKGHSYGSIFFSAQPNKSELKSLKKNGFVAVINLRGKKEKKYSEAWERKLVKSEGINYYNIPFSMKKEMTNEYIDAVTSKILAHRKDGKVLVHCSSGNRVAIWLGAHFQKDHGLSADEALAKAKTMGLTKAKAEDKLKSYLYK